MNDTSTIYADYQATTPLDPRVRDRMAPFWNESFGNPHSSGHIVGWQAHLAVDAAASSVAALIGADPDEIVFTSGATEANNLALFGPAFRAPRGRRRILVSAIEHKCTLSASQAIAKRMGFSVESIPVNPEGLLDLAAFQSALGDDVLLASIMAVNNEVGTIQDLPRVSGLLAPHGILLHCDAAQAPCAVNTKTFASHADFISLSAHKMYGPQGIGALYIRRELQERIEPLIYGGDQQKGLRSGTLPLPLCVGMGVAAELAANGEADSERKRIGNQRDEFVRQIENGNPCVSLNGPGPSRRHPGNANLKFVGHEAEEILGALQPKLAASTGSACTTGMPELSHVLLALGLSTDECDASIRFSFGRFTTDDDVKSAADLVLRALQDGS
ncbi:MAG: cysteine desulfurase family protein [Rhodobacteraceae bacterium]|nr:cysteine desulfurase family protein [Paracoccaceae bacterium]